MPQPLSHPDLRRQNLSLLLGHLLRREEWTRKQIEQETGLSKATVSRLVDDLLQNGALRTVSAPAAASAATRGRRAETLTAPSTLGVVAGLSLGIHATSIHLLDLSGRELASSQLPTPRWRSRDEAVRWAAETAENALQGLNTPLRHLVVAVPARAINGEVITHPPLFMSTIAGADFGRLLGERLGCPVRLELDAAMVLAGLETLGFIEGGAFPVLLNLGSVLTMSLRRRDGTIAAGNTASFGDFDLIPVETGIGAARVGALLGAHGLFEASQRLGGELRSMDELWRVGAASAEQGEIARLREAFFAALDHAIRVIMVMADPRLIIFTGRLAPLADQFLTGSADGLLDELAEPPTFRVIGHASNDYAAAVGAACESRAAAMAALLSHVSRVGLDALT